MNCFVRDISTWDHIAQFDVEKYDIPLFSSDNSTGTIRVIGEHPECSKCWIIFDGFLFYLESASPSDGFTDFTVSEPINAFSRSLVYTGTGTENLEEFIATTISSNYISQQDSMYAMPYLSVSYSGDTSADVDYLANEVFYFRDIVDLAEEKKIGFDFEMTSSGLSLLIHSYSPSSYNVFFEDSHNFLESSTVSNELVAKVTVRRISVGDDDVITVTSSSNYYWHDDGTITTTPPDPRIKGTWDIVSVDDDDIESLVVAQESMENNSEAVKIEFRSDSAYSKWDSISCTINNRLFTEPISACRIDSENPLFLYELGTKPVTLTKKVSNYTYKRKTKPIAYELQEDDYLSQYGGTVGGNVSISNNLSTNKLIIGDSSFGSSLPSSGVYGQVFFKI